MIVSTLPCDGRPEMTGAAPGATLQLVPLYPGLHTHTACSSFQESSHKMS